MNGTIRVGNKRQSASEEYHPEAGDVIINIDRPNLLGNPYVTSSTMPRRAAIERFQDDLDADIEARGRLFAECARIAGLVLDGKHVILMCWCVPHPCHGHVIKSVVEKMVASPVRHERS